MGLWISIHSLRMEGDCAIIHSRSQSKAFQSTPSAWRETCRLILLRFVCMYFNPLPPHGGRHAVLFAMPPQIFISIHSLRMEGDIRSNVEYQYQHVFQSTPSAWRETLHAVSLIYAHVISIHSLRMEGDPIVSLVKRFSMNFNPLPPHGGRRLTGAF